MKIKGVSSFKDQYAAERFFADWVHRVRETSGTFYEKINVETGLGNTVVWAINSHRTDLQALVIFPGFRTCALFWDLDNALGVLKDDFRIFLVDTNGQPCLSDGNSPDVKTNDYGLWAKELLDRLSIDSCVVAGASFGGLIGLKLSLVAPQFVTRLILLNPGCLQSFSLSPRNLYYNFLPLILPTRTNIEKFLNNAIFFGNYHSLSVAAKKLILDYELFAITQFRNRAQTPYPLSIPDLMSLKSPVHLIVGDKDILFPYKKSIAIAQKYIYSLRGVYIVPNAGHGIETSKQAINILSEIAKNEEVYV
jgi:pimeloyl-ACP methyl ester carboxylesterase